MSTATKSQWEGRLGIEAVGRMGGCCAQTMLKWRPQMIGQRNSCSYCGTVMKAVRAGEGEAPAYTGGLNEHLREAASPELVLGGLYFESGKFPTTEKADEWMDDRDILAKADELDMHAHYAPIERLLPETIRAVVAGPGVIAEIGVAEKQVATGGGQASMHSPGITTTSMAAGGTSHPIQQGPAAVAVGQGAMPSLVSGVVEMNDGHQHEYHLVPFPANDGWRVKGYTSFNNGHTHYVEGHLNKDGTVDLHTNPDQAPVGGHAHRHRLVWKPGVTVSLPKNVSEEAVYGNSGKEYRVTSQDVVTLRRASGLIKTFCDSLGGDRDGLAGSVAASMAEFQDQLSQAIERARGQVAHREGFVYLAKEDLDRLGSCGNFVGEFGERLAGGIGMEKDLEGDDRPFDEGEVPKARKGEGVEVSKQVPFSRPTVDEINAISEVAGKGNPGQIEHLIEWVADVGVSECVEQVRASDRASVRVDDPIKACAWLKSQANEAAQTAEE